MKTRIYDIELLKKKFKEIPLIEARKLYNEGPIYIKSLETYGITKDDLFQHYFPGDKIIVDDIPCYVVDTYLGIDRPRWVVADIVLTENCDWNTSMKESKKDIYMNAPRSINNLFGKKKILLSKDWHIPSSDDFTDFGPNLNVLCAGENYYKFFQEMYSNHKHLIWTSTESDYNKLYAWYYDAYHGTIDLHLKSNTEISTNRKFTSLLFRKLDYV